MEEDNSEKRGENNFDLIMTQSAGPEVQQNHNQVGEIRNYELNKDKSLRKKLKATEIVDLTIVPTDGGVKFTMNTGMYELFKVTADAYFSSDEMKDKSTCTSVLDKKRSHVETKYKVVTGKSSHYTMNMYHTKCSLLVNGRGTRQFLSIDFHEIMSRLDTYLTENGESLEKFNQQIKHVLLEYFSVPDCTVELGMEADHTVHEAKAIECPDENAESSHPDENAESSHPDENAESSHQVCEENELVTILKNLQSDMKYIKDTLSSHIQNTNLHFESLRDEVVSIKKQQSLLANKTDSDIDTVSCNVNEMHVDIRKFNDTIQGRVQSVGDRIISIMKEAHEPTNENRPTINSSREEKSAKTSRRKVRATESQEITPEVRPRIKTVMIGDSILRDAHLCNLDENVEVKSISGGKTWEVGIRLRQWPFIDVKNIVIYIGGNDAASNHSLDKMYNDLRDGIQKVRRDNDDQCKIFLCTVCPRDDCDITPVNNMLTQLSQEMNVNIIDSHNAFIFGNGKKVQEYYNSDGIHLSERGTGSLVHVINDSVNISNKSTSESLGGMTTPRQTNSAVKSSLWCSHCKMNNHSTAECGKRSRDRPEGNGIRYLQTTGRRSPQKGYQRLWCVNCEMSNHSTDQCEQRFTTPRKSRRNEGYRPRLWCAHCKMTNHNTNECGRRTYGANRSRCSPDVHEKYRNQSYQRTGQNANKWCSYCEMINHNTEDCGFLTRDNYGH